MYLLWGDDWEGKFDFLKDYCEVVYLPRTPEISTRRLRRILERRKMAESRSFTGRLKRPVKRAILLFGMKHPGFRKLWKRLLYRKRRLYYRYRCAGVRPDKRAWCSIPSTEKTYGCSPRAVYEYMISHSEFDGWKLYGLSKTRKAPVSGEESQHHGDQPASKGLRTVSGRAGYWITNYGCRIMYGRGRIRCISSAGTERP